MHHRVRGAVLGSIAAVIVPLGLPRIAFAEEEPVEADVGAPAKVVPPSTSPPVVTEAATVAPAAKKFSWEAFGYLRLQYRMVRNDPNVQFVGRDDGFELQNARIGAKGSYEDRIRFVIAIDGAVDERAHLNVPEGKLRVGLRDAYADVVVNGDLVARAGYFETLVDPDLEGDTTREFVDRPLESRGVRATEGYETPGLPPGRSLGAALRLDPDPPEAGARVGFELAVQNGADEYSSGNDNDTPAASASVLARFPGNSWVVASGRFNRRTEGELPFRQDEDDLQGSFGAKLALGPASIGAGAVFQRTMFPTTDGPVQNAYGAHAQLTFAIPADLPLMFGYRFGILDRSSLVLTDRVMEHTGGATLSVPAYRMRLQLQITTVMEQGARTLKNDRVQLAAEVSL